MKTSKPVATVPALTKQLAVAISTSIVVSAIVLYALWFWVVMPDNQQKFTTQVTNNVERYRTNITAYISQVDNNLTTFIDDIPDALLTTPTDAIALNQWLSQHQKDLQKSLSHVKEIKFVSSTEIEMLFQLPPQAEDSTAVSFLLIDMINRLQTGQRSRIEAAKINNSSQWQLHKVMLVSNRDGIVQGAIHFTLSLEGISQIFRDVDPALARVMLIQSIDNEKPLTFFLFGQGDSGYRQRFTTIEDSYWQMTYQPSLLLSQTTHRIPMWFYILGFVLPVALTIIVLWANRQPSPKADNKTKAKKESKKPQEKPSLSSSSPDVVPAEDSTALTNTPQKQVDNQDKATKEPALSEPFPHTIFRAYDIRGIAYKQFSQDLAVSIGQAVASEVLKAGDQKMIVGYDARTHSPNFASSVIEGIVSTGCDVIDIGLVPTPLMNFSACHHPDTSSGMIITASHNPKEYNGCKIVVKGQTLVEGDIQRIKARIINRDLTASSNKGEVTNNDFSQAYIDRVVSDVAVMEGWKVVVDAGNGASSDLAPRLFDALQCQTTPLFCEFDGEFPNHAPDPCVIENLKPLVSTVKEQKVDVGFAFDGDGDRVMVVTATGRILWPDQLLMLFAQDVVARNPGSDVVFDSKSTHLLSHVITENGGRPIMWKTGHSHIKAKMRETHALLGGEFSGHIFFKERWYGFDDGLYAAARLLELMTLTGQTVDDMLSSLPQMISTPEIKITVTEEKKFGLVDELARSSTFTLDGDVGERTLVDGIRVDFETGWGLVRASNTAPALTLRFEAVDEKSLKAIQALFKREIHAIDHSLSMDF